MKRLPGPKNAPGLTVIERLMRHHRLTTRDLAAITGLSHSTVQRIARGTGKPPRIDAAIKMARAFFLTVEDVWGKR